MEDCKNLANCSFFKKYEEDEWLRDALKGYVKLYCKGNKQDDCIRKKVSKLLGGPEKVPMNMKPNGQPIIGTTDADWSDEVKRVIA